MCITPTEIITFFSRGENFSMLFLFFSHYILLLLRFDIYLLLSWGAFALLPVQHHHMIVLPRRELLPLPNLAGNGENSRGWNTTGGR